MNVLNFWNRTNSWMTVKLYDVGFSFSCSIVDSSDTDEDEQTGKDEEVLRFGKWGDVGHIPVAEPVSTEDLPDSSGSTGSRTGRGKVTFLRL
jgi:hypothetical protein